MAESIVLTMGAYHHDRQLLLRYEEAQRRLQVQQSPPPRREEPGRPRREQVEQGEGGEWGEWEPGARSPPPARQHRVRYYGAFGAPRNETPEEAVVDRNDNEPGAPDNEVLTWLDRMEDSLVEMDRRIAGCREALIAGRIALEESKRQQEKEGEAEDPLQQTLRPPLRQTLQQTPPPRQTLQQTLPPRPATAQF